MHFRMNIIDNEFISGKLKSEFGNKILNIEILYGLLTITIEKNSNIEIVGWLANEKDLQFTFLTDLTGIHYPEQKGQELGVVYHLHSFKNNIRLRLKLFVNIENPIAKSMTEVFGSANWMERETYDFYGILFEGHPNLKRILNMDEMDYFPMQKQYPLEDQEREDKNDKFFGR
jgi:NADH-quinone oxidoreductase subunit C